MASNHFSEVDMMILAQMAYYDVPGMSYKSTGITVPLDEMLENVEGKLIKEGIDPNLIESFKNKIGNGKYVITKAENDRDNTGFAALAITGPDPDTVTIAARGTEGFNLKDHDSRKDIATDIQLAHKIEANQQKKMNEFMLGMEEYDNIYMTAHSLGGNLIVSGAINFLFPEKIKGVNTYNAPGQNAAYLITHSDGISKVKDKITNYQNEGDGVSDAMIPVGEVVIIKSKIGDSWGEMVGENHSLYTYEVENGSFKRSQEGKSLKHKIVQGASIAITTYICVYKYITHKFIPEFIGMVVDKVKNFIKTLRSLKGKAINIEPIIKVDTYKLRNYADRLESVNRRINSIDNRLDSLYTKVAFEDLWNLLKADLFTTESKKIKKCISYLEDTAEIFETCERNIINKLR